MKYVVEMQAIGMEQARKPADQRTGHFTVQVDLAQILESSPGPNETAHVRMRDGQGFVIDLSLTPSLSVVQV